MPKKILIVDDEPDLLEILSIRMGKAGYEIHGAANGQEALRLARSIMPDLIILDVYLPLINGDEVAKILKSDEKFRHIPIILISATTKTLARRINYSGADDCFTKPFEPEEFMARIKDLLA